MGRRKRRTYPDLAAFFEESDTTQAEFAARINKSQSYVSKVRHGVIEPNLGDALVIAREAGVPLESLIRPAAAVSR
jgi:transcriptional regulator with XRE-family HTH domain